MTGANGFDLEKIVRSEAGIWTVAVAEVVPLKAGAVS